MSEIVMTFNSEDRSGGSNESPEFKFATSMTIGGSYSILSCSIPNTVYNIRSGVNDQLDFNDNVPATFNAIITPGVYDAVTLASTLQSAMNALFAGFTVTYNLTTMKMEWANAATFQIQDTSNMAEVLGITTTAALATTQSSDTVVNLGSFLGVYIYSKTFAKARNSYSYIDSGNIKPDIIHKVNTRSNGGGVINFEQKTHRTTFQMGDKRINNVDFSLRDRNGDVIDLNGQNWQIEIRTLYFQNR